MARRKRKWWEKKTNWAIILGVIATSLAALPASTVIPVIGSAMVAAKIVGGVAATLGGYGIADRAGKENEEVE